MIVHCWDDPTAALKKVESYEIVVILDDETARGPECVEEEACGEARVFKVATLFPTGKSLSCGERYEFIGAENLLTLIVNGTPSNEFSSCDHRDVVAENDDGFLSCIGFTPRAVVDNWFTKQISLLKDVHARLNPVVPVNAEDEVRDHYNE